MKEITKTLPKVGDKLYLHSETGHYMIDMVKDPYTVIGVNPDENEVFIQECHLVFYGDRYYDTVADEIRVNPYGEVKKLKFSPKRGWYVPPASNYCKIAVFGEWKHQPYLD